MSPPLRFADPQLDTVDDLVDLDRYPIADPGSPAWRSTVDQTIAALAYDGCATLDGFLRPAALDRASQEIADLAPKAFMRIHLASVYARTDSQAALPGDDPRAMVFERHVGHITRDQMPPDSVMHRLYVSHTFKAFVAGCVRATRIFEYADPLAGLIATVIPPGGQLSWHYDTNEYVITAMTRAPDAGGEFEFAPNLRRPGDENLDGLGLVLRGEAPELLATRLLRPGDVQIFLGRYSLHRVTEVRGANERHVAVLSYANRPGVIGPVDRTRAVYGRVTEAHLVAEQLAAQAPDALIF